MAFTFSQTNSDNQMETYNLEISIDPAAGTINQVLEVGDTVAEDITIVNTGDVNTRVYLTADWGPGSGTTDLEATLLANAIEATVYVSADPDPTQAYSGSLIGLQNQQIVDISATADTTVYISLVVPDNRSGPTLLNKALHTDFVFVAISVEA